MRLELIQAKQLIIIALLAYIPTVTFTGWFEAWVSKKCGDDLPEQFGFLTLDSLSFFFALMVGSKAINYALNGPALKQLYIPTTSDVRFKAQAWIETFGSRASKEAGSLFNMLLRPMQSIFGAVAGRANYLTLSGAIGFPLLVLWFAIAVYLGRNFRKAIDEKKVIC